MERKKKNSSQAAKAVAGSDKTTPSKPVPGGRAWYMVIPRPIRSAYRRVTPRVIR